MQLFPLSPVHVFPQDNLQDTRSLVDLFKELLIDLRRLLGVLLAPCRLHFSVVPDLELSLVDRILVCLLHFV